MKVQLTELHICIKFFKYFATEKSVAKRNQCITYIFRKIQSLQKPCIVKISLQNFVVCLNWIGSGCCIDAHLNMEPESKTDSSVAYANFNTWAYAIAWIMANILPFPRTKSSINYYYSKLSYQGHSSFTSLVTSPTASGAHVVRTQGRSDYGSIIIEGGGYAVHLSSLNNGRWIAPNYLAHLSRIQLNTVNTLFTPFGVYAVDD